jgi:hypothetical protein
LKSSFYQETGEKEINDFGARVGDVSQSNRLPRGNGYGQRHVA